MDQNLADILGEVLEELKGLNEDEANLYLGMLFEGYTNRKKEKRLFEEGNNIPELIILTYYTCVKKPQFSNIYENFKQQYITDDSIKNFKERYIYNENKLEEVHTKEERLGLRRVYDYIQAKEDLENVNLYTLTDIHEILYSATDYPEFGGKYRRDVAYLSKGRIELVSPYMIVREMNGLRYEIDDLVEMGNKLGKNIEPEKIIDYVDRCIDLKCKLIKIHPFGDGNGRSVRAFTNLLFRLANIPPIYIENKEKEKYSEAMQLALGENDLSKILKFYHYKICDSIISLDVYYDKDNSQSSNLDNKGESPKVKSLNLKNNTN